MIENEDKIRDQIEQWVSEIGLDAIDEVASAIAETNYIFDEEYCEDVELTKVDDTQYEFVCHVTMTGEPRKEDVVFCGDKINVVIEGYINFNEESDEWEIDDDPSISAEVEDWRGEDFEDGRPRNGKLTRVSIQNFKGIGSKVDVDLKPVTLLFGPNSAGKSSILHAIHCAHTILVTGNADVEKTLLGGDIDLGGFANFVHDRDIDKPVTFFFEFEPGADDLFDFLEGPFEFSERPAPIASVQIQNIGVLLNMEWSPYKNSPIVSRFHVTINGKSVAELGASKDGAKTWLTVVNEDHPLLQHDPEYKADGRFETMEIPIPLPNGMALPGADIANLPKLMGINVPKQLSLFEHSSFGGGSGSGAGDGYEFGNGSGYGSGAGDGSGAGWGFGTDDQEVLIRIGILMSLARPCLERVLERFRYVGPIRQAPPRNYIPPKHDKEDRWASGLGAWDAMAKNESLCARVNLWLNTPEKLDTGYRIDWVKFKELDESTFNRMRTASANFELDEMFNQLTAALPESGRLVISEEKKDLQLAPGDLGEGIAQVVPVITAALSESMTTASGRNALVQMVAIEQPELHIHPRMQVILGDLFLSQASERQFLIETHSEHLMLRLLRRIRETHEKELPAGIPKVTVDTISVLYVEQNDGGVQIRPLRFDDDGDFIDTWPGGFFDERFEEQY